MQLPLKKLAIMLAAIICLTSCESVNNFLKSTNALIKLDSNREPLERVNPSQYEIFLIYDSNCNQCPEYFQQLKLFARRYFIQVIPISLDGSLLNDDYLTKKQTIIDNIKRVEKRFDMEFSRLPVTILSDRREYPSIEYHFIGYKIFSQAELKEWIERISNKVLVAPMFG